MKGAKDGKDPWITSCLQLLENLTFKTNKVHGEFKVPVTSACSETEWRRSYSAAGGSVTNFRCSLVVCTVYREMTIKFTLSQFSHFL